MKLQCRIGCVFIIMLAVALTACAGMETVVRTPGVSLRNVQVEKLDFSGQTFLLDFDVTNPNPFPLPIRSVSYGIELDGHHFAGGSTQSAFTVAAQGDAQFSISVELDLLQTSPPLLYILHEGVSRDIPYTLKGQFGVDIAYLRPVAFRTSGEIRLYAARF
ncbi:MAG: LEA type 2 family protein [Gammaproteobacteria bacterium]|nr:LEA type 2 family protein [Gammaproteobacteria bacterium]